MGTAHLSYNTPGIMLELQEKLIDKRIELLKAQRTIRFTFDEDLKEYLKEEVTKLKKETQIIQHTIERIGE